MHRLTRTVALLLPCALVCLAACAPAKPVVRDQLIVEKLRMRITKVRNAAAETRAVIAASRGAPYLAELHMRLAELLSEEARYHYMVAYEREQRRTKSLHVPQVRFLKEQSINTYRFILEKYPKTHLADRILFNISQEQRELGEFDGMQTSLQKLVDDYSDSAYRTEALLVLGDFHFDKMQFVKADSYYRQIISKKRSPLLGLAYYKLAWVEVNKGNCKQALKHFEKAIHAARKSPDKGQAAAKRKTAGVQPEFAIPDSNEADSSFAGHKSVNVQREALVDLTYCYAQERKPEKAAEFLRGLASTREAYVAALAKMANRYALIEQPRGAADVARELLRLAPDDEERLDDARMLHTAISRMKDYSDVGEDVFLVLRALRRRLLHPDLDEAAHGQLVKEFEIISRDMATKSHEILMSEDKGAKVSKWTKEPATPEETALAYETYLVAMPESPNQLLVVQNLADVLMEGKQFLKAGHRYREAATLLAEPPPPPVPPPPPKKGEKAPKKKTEAELAAEQKAAEKQRKADRLTALYDAVVAYQSSLETEGARGHLERATARAGLRRAGGLLLAEGLTDAEKSKKIKFAIAQSYYDEGRYIEAIDLLTAVAYEFPGTKQGDAALHMALDSLRTLNDMNGLINTGRRFIAKDSPFSDVIKKQIAPIVAAAEQNRLDELSLAASGEQAGGMEILLAFADRYKDSDLGERAMLSAFVAARARGDTSELYTLGEAVISKFPASNQVAGVVSTMGRTAAARFEFDRAIEYLERAADKSTEQRAALLITAGELRAQLADRKGALEDFRKALAASEGPARSEAASHLADLIERDSTPSQVVEALTPLNDPPNPEIASRLGLALLRTGKPDDAEMLLRDVVEGATEASAAAQARANYGMAEIMLNMLEQFDPPPDLDAIEEAIGLVDVVVQSYLSAVRQPDPVYAQAALARLARAAEVGADKLEQIKLPPELSADESALIKEAMSRRAEGLRNDVKAVLADCARRSKATFLLDEAGRSCITGTTPKEDPVRYHNLSARKKTAKLKNVEGARERLSRNPDDLEALRLVGAAFLDAGDPHAARLVLGRTVEAGGDADDLNLLGMASHAAGDTMGALDAFGRAKEAGSPAAFYNLAAMAKQLGVNDLVDELLAEAPQKTEGRLLGAAKALRGRGKGGAR